MPSSPVLRALLALFTTSLALAPCAAQTAAPSATSQAIQRSDVIAVQDLCTLQGHGASVLRGIGLVTGLKGTGDSGADMVLARPLAELYKNNGIILADPRELAKAKSVALVWLEVRIDENGARANDGVDVFVSVMHSATSLAGGRLLVSPMTGPKAGDTTTYAFASGPIELESKDVVTVGRIRGGASMAMDVSPETLGGSFNLICHQDVRGWAVSSQVADAINALQPETDIYGDGGGSASIARAVDEATIHVEIPQAERVNPARFLSKVLTATFSPTLLRLPAQVIVNSRTGCIIVTGNVEISEVAIAHKDLVISTTTPPLPGPVTEVAKATSLGTTGRTSDKARIQDLLAALKALDVPVEDQIAVLTQIHRSGRMHARLVID